ncbi:MAG: hypothetical protein H0W61_14735 [Bacteroidetes bacterium]|nr:hypothetical protein [Bacteroidota bacterium]
MKSPLKTILAILFMTAFIHGHSQTAVQYMDKMGKEFNKISEETWDYTRAVAHGKKARQIENQRKQMLNANRNALLRIKNMGPFSGDASYRDSTLRYLEMSYAVLNNDYSKIVDMEEISEQSYDAMEAYMMAQEKANEKLDEAFAVASDAQKAFAKNNNITLLSNESKTEEKLDKAGEVFKFYNKIYLVFFKPYKQELYLIEAQSKGDINAMKQNQESLAKLSKEAKEKLKTITPYKNNTTLKASCQDLLDFYVMEAETKVPQLVDFYLKKEKFEKMKIAMDKKGKNSSNEEVNEFNTAVNDYNKSINDYNTVNNDLNKKRSTYLESWNNAVSRFLDKNVSKKK